MIYYKIRNKKTGLFSKGGEDPSWNTVGKVWSKLGHLRLHITSVMQYEWQRPDFDNWEVIEYEVTEKAVKSVIDIVDNKKIFKILANK